MRETETFLQQVFDGSLTEEQLRAANFSFRVKSYVDGLDVSTLKAWERAGGPYEIGLHVTPGREVQGGDGADWAVLYGQQIDGAYRSTTVAPSGKLMTNADIWPAGVETIDSLASFPALALQLSEVLGVRWWVSLPDDRIDLRMKKMGRRKKPFFVWLRSAIPQSARA